jgi:transposase
MKSLPLDTRQRIVNAVKSGETMAHVARLFQVSYSSVMRYINLAAKGSLEPKKRTGRTKLKLTPAIVETIKTWLKEKNDLTLKQIQQKLIEQFQLEVTESAIWYRLVAMKFTWKKKRHMQRSGSAKTLSNAVKTGQPK